MKSWSMTLLAAAAALALQACDLRVRDAATAESGGAVTEPASPAPVAQDDSARPTDSTVASGDNTLASPGTTAASPDSPAGSGSNPIGTTPPTDPSLAAGPGSAMPGSSAPDAGLSGNGTLADGSGLSGPPAQPQTGAMGAPGADTTAPGVAAPTELGQFLQKNPVGARDAQQESADGSGK